MWATTLTLELIGSTAFRLEQRWIEAGLSHQQDAAYGSQAHALAVLIALTRAIDQATFIFKVVLQ